MDNELIIWAFLDFEDFDLFLVRLPNYLSSSSRILLAISLTSCWDNFGSSCFDFWEFEENLLLDRFYLAIFYLFLESGSPPTTFDFPWLLLDILLATAFGYLLDYEIDNFGIVSYELVISSRLFPVFLFVASNVLFSLLLLFIGPYLFKTFYISLIWLSYYSFY